MLKWMVLCEENNEVVWQNLFELSNSFNHDLKEIYSMTLTKEKFENMVKIALLNFWSRIEYEVLVTDFPCYVELKDVVDAYNEITSGKSKYRTQINIPSKKIDVYEQVAMNWDVFINYLWNNLELIEELS